MSDPVITYDWCIEQLLAAPEKDGLTDVVQTIHWRLNAEAEDGLTATCYGSVGLQSPDPDEFVAYEGLSKETVVGWLHSTMGEDEVIQIEANLMGEINKKRNPPVVAKPVPWS